MAGQTRTILTIEGDLVTEKQETIVRQSPLQNFLPLLERRPPIYTPLLPTGARAQYWNEENPAKRLFDILIERDPMIVHINYERAIHTVSIPYSRFFVRATTDNPARNSRWSIADIRTFWSKQKFRDENAMDMVQAMVPNIYENGQICFGTTGVDANQTLADRLDAIVNNFYVTDFTNHFTTRYPNGWRSFAEWEKMTKDNPMGWLEWPDWDAGSRHEKFSWKSLTDKDTPDRTVPVFTDQGIPPLDPGATWGAANEWWLTLTNNNRARLRDIMTQTPADLMTAIAEPV